jgi:hypothetical protein
MQSDCRLTPIVAGGSCRIDRCEHGTVHLTIGDLTLRLSERALCNLADTLAVARVEFTEPKRRSLLC